MAASIPHRQSARNDYRTVQRYRTVHTQMNTESPNVHPTEV